MSSGYVLNFSDRTFRDFVTDSVNKDIFDKRYRRATGSKANCLRGFWAEESNHVAGKLTRDLLDYVEEEHSSADLELIQRCRLISDRLLARAPIDGLEEIESAGITGGLEAIASAVKDSISRNQPEIGVDRLHTYTVKLIRAVCGRRGIVCDRSKPLHSLFGEYVKVMRESGEFSSDMTERILKFAISALEAFSRVRNEHSLAHDNPVLGYDEALLISSNVVSVLRFVISLEQRSDERGRPPTVGEEEDLPF